MAGAGFGPETAVIVAASAFMYLFVPAIVGLAIWFAWHRYQQGKKWRAANIAFAAERGWFYVENDPRLAVFAHTAPYGQGRSPSAFGIATGEHRGRWFAIFTYRYWTDSTDSNGRRSSRPHDHAIVAIEAPGAAPVVRITPERFGAKLDKALGGIDVEVESREFNRRWRVWSRDQQAAHALLAPHVIDMLLSTAWLGDSVVFEPGRAFTYRRGAATFAHAEKTLDDLCDLVDAVPDFVFGRGGGAV